MSPAEVQSAFTALQEEAAFAASGDISRHYGFITVRTIYATCKAAAPVSCNRRLRLAQVQDHCLACGWKLLRIKTPVGSFDDITRAAYVILQGAFFRTVCCYSLLPKQ